MFGPDNLRFQQGDASDLAEFADGRFDLVVSIFGAMFAPRPFDVAKEMVRVTKPGGRIVMGNWIPGDPTLVAQILKISAAYTPPPPTGFISPMLWGDEGQVKARFAIAGIRPENIAFQRATWRLPPRRSAERAAGDLPRLLRSDHERVRSSRRKPGARTSCKPS